MPRALHHCTLLSLCAEYRPAAAAACSRSALLYFSRALELLVFISVFLFYIINFCFCCLSAIARRLVASTVA
jgi:hypothetical protein